MLIRIPFYQDECREDAQNQELLFARQCIKEELERFLVAPEKPMILTICRPDKRKNIEGLIEAYGEDKDLKLMANLVIFAGIRKDIQDQKGSAKEVLTRMLLMMDKYNLYGKMAIPKKHDLKPKSPNSTAWLPSITVCLSIRHSTSPSALLYWKLVHPDCPLLPQKTAVPKRLFKNAKAD